MKRQVTLEKAKELVVDKRDAEYGSPGANALMISRLWSAYLGIDLKPKDVFPMMALLKLSRTRHSPEKADHYYDIAGYAACAAEVVNAKDKEEEYADSEDNTNN